MVPTRSPKMADRRPLGTEFPVRDATAVMPNRASINISGGPKLSAYRPRMGARSNAITPPITVPLREEAKEQPKACPAMPFFVMG